MKRCYFTATVAAVMTLGAAGVFASSTPVPVNTSPQENRLWETIRSNEVDLAWRWEADAATAQLRITGMNGLVLATNLSSSVSSLRWQAYAPDAQPAEEVYNLVMTFYGPDAEMVGAQTSRLAVVASANGAVKVDAAPDASRWNRVAQYAVISYDARWNAATVDATASRLVIEKDGLPWTFAFPDPAGYFGWRLQGGDWGYGTFDLALDFPGTAPDAWEATLIRMPTETVIAVR